GVDLRWQSRHVRLSSPAPNPIAAAGRPGGRPWRYSRGMPEIHAARRGRAQKLIRESGADAALITAGPNVRYLSGLASSNAALLLPAEGDQAVLATDSRYTGAARRDAPDLDLLEERFIEAKLIAEAVRRGVRRLAFEAHEMTVERHADLAGRSD